MPSFDPSQSLALALDRARHARVLGAPGSGKTTVLVEVAVGEILAATEAANRAAPGGFSLDRELLVLTADRRAAARLRSSIEDRLGRPIESTPARTFTAFAFGLLAKDAASRGAPAPRLLTGTAHDEAISATIADPGISAAAEVRELIGVDAVQSPAFRAELRELARIIDDFGWDSEALSQRIVDAARASAGERVSRAPDAALASRWIAALRLLGPVELRLAAEHPGERSASGLLAAAARSVRESDAGFRAPRIVLVDDAQDLGEGQLALLAALADRGSRIWVFGDPDIATAAFHGESTEVLSDLAGALRRAGARAEVAHEPQTVVLGLVHRQTAPLREFVAGLSARIGAAGVGAQRAAIAAAAVSDSADAGDGDRIAFARASTSAEQLGAVAHRLRRRRLGLDGISAVPWDRMAVLCRSRGEATRAARALAGLQVPTDVGSGGIVPGEHRIVRELLRLLQHALGISDLRPAEILDIAGGTIGGLDPVALRRLRAGLSLHERRRARAADRPTEAIEGLVAEAFAFPGDQPLIDSRGGRVLRRIGLIAAAGRAVAESGGTARETLWAIWERTRLSERWQEDALTARGVVADEANRSLDAVLGLFFSLQRHEEQASRQPVAELIEALLDRAVPEDSLARRSERSTVTVTTPQGAVGREFDVVCVLGPQDGAWPNLRSRGAMLGTAALERWLRGGPAEPPSRRETLHDELRLFVQACSRARTELLVLGVSDDEQHPSPFFGFGAAHEVPTPPSSRLTLRGSVAQMRRRLEDDPADAVALASLVALAEADVPGARPDEWYGVLPPSTDAPLVDLDGDPDAVVRVSPSQLEQSEQCPLDWVVSRLAGPDGGASSGLGTLLHHAMETAETPDVDALMDAVLAEWDRLPFESEWQSEQGRRTARAMATGLADYLAQFIGSDRELVDSEARFEARIDRALLVGSADRIEQTTRSDGGVEWSVVDLKTGRFRPSAADLAEHAQLQAYQLGVIMGAFAHESDVVPGGLPGNGGARLLFVHPKAVRAGTTFTEAGQEPLDAEAQGAFRERVGAAATVMAGDRFTARVEHHCSDPHRPGSCAIHIVPAVSHS
ncbi:hypothetical protein BMH32_12235 [Leucobacter sp. OLJS4]|uniref:UrvD/REP family ATP-dependent DNA helicase n=1 Tax=unclassified Leucobacter TaxID=2621730 RepID=UPI000C17F11E|nr:MULTISPECIES: UrvD/REP family ATP-dependent DNA helicase [unclassified Leucobacter]PII81752.1 hypothetical protein BMH25_14810 [Leucobacter sp. OLCALW19]PII86426.1 hypothetical protein BMH26_15245 [Leucobacter sp. OLTLW20]PII90321.1 hypothetical protein BMH27_13410 [Leucobacter sp. OLAS13]PII97354.1 hypothetical protein BMH29_14095 [Leucobacter sp. OLDS2]PIJ00879.1 hypothetical protein BMH28_08295 [Leucobacter sp. OLCS4]